MPSRKKPGGTALTAALLLPLLAILGGCGDDTAAPQTAADPTVDVTITVKEVDVIAECEGTTGTNPGDFTFNVLFYTSDQSIATQTYSGTFSGLTGQAVDIPDIVIKLNRRPPKDGRLYLEFQVTELDNNVPDSGMNDARGILELVWPTGDAEEDTYPERVTGSARCSVLFVSTMKAVQRQSSSGP